VIIPTGQYQLVTAAMAMTLAAMGGSFVFFVLMREKVALRYRSSIVIAAVVVGIAAFHYSRVLASWADAFQFRDGAYVASGAPFFEAYRYADWLVTVPLLLAQLVLALGMTGPKARSLIVRLSVAAAAMIALGYPGEVINTTSSRLIWGLAGCVPFAYILYVLWVELGRSLLDQTREVALTVSYARWMLLLTWTIYPVSYFVPLLGLDPATTEAVRQVGYSLADLVAKPGYGLLIYRIARLKTEADEAELTSVGDDVRRLAHV
jgi:bacteriorhodopsin